MIEKGRLDLERTYEVHWTDNWGRLNIKGDIKHHQEAFLAFERVKGRDDVIKAELFEVDRDPSLKMEVARRLLIRWKREIGSK